MILLPCPWCGPRDASEFGHVGEPVPRPDPAAASPAQWRSYLYLRANTCGWVAETWYHRLGCRRFIKVERHTETNETRESRQPWLQPAADAGGPAQQARAASG
jgi:heterotetrameric sarcosine oxidase delta subunit